MRIRWIVVAITSVVLLAGCDWPTFMDNGAHTGASSDTSISATDVAIGLTEKWQASLGTTSQANIPSSPVVANGLVYVGTQGGVVEAFKADGGTNCDTSTPKRCQAFWTSAPLLATFTSTPTVAGGLVYIGGSDGRLYVYDAAGVTNCTVSSHTVCFPLWTSTQLGSIESSPVVTYGKVYVGSDDGAVYAFDAAGQHGCTNQECSPYFADQTGGAVRSSPAVTNDVLYVGSDSGNLDAFDAHGIQKCSPQHVCQPLWVGPTGAAVHSSPAVADGRVFVGSEDTKLYAFDATGQSGCSGTTTVTCQPLWTATTANFVESSPAVANGVVFIGTLAGAVGARLDAFDAAGTTNCSGAPRSCQPLWTSGTLGLFVVAPVSVANGVVYVDADTGISSFSGSVYAFDATAPLAQCSGVPKVCSPLANLQPSEFDTLASAPSVANGLVYVSGSKLRAFGK